MMEPATPMVKKKSGLFSIFFYTDFYLPLFSKRVISKNGYLFCRHHDHCPEEVYVFEDNSTLITLCMMVLTVR